MDRRNLTQIICTINATTATEQTIAEMSECGMDIARINLSHTNRSQYENVVKLIKKVRKKTNKDIKISFDTRGVEYRVASKCEIKICKDDHIAILESGDVAVLKSDGFAPGISSSTFPDDSKILRISGKMQIPEVCKDDVLLIDDGRLLLRVEEASKNMILAVSKNGGVVRQNSKISVPGLGRHMEVLTPEDKEDIELGAGLGIDMVFVSFVEDSQDIMDVVQLINGAYDANDSERDACEVNNSERGANRISKIQIIAKIESRRGVTNLRQILGVADGIMIARGDLCNSVGISEMFSTQKQIAREVNESSEGKKKLLIMATEMLQSMINSSRPTRAEISDIGNAVLDGCSALMLSGETALGEYPLESITIMKRIIEDTETNLLN